MSAIPPKADIDEVGRDVRFVPIGDIQAAVEYDCVGKVLKFVEHPREAFPTQILTPCCQYRRASADLALCSGSVLSRATGAPCRRRRPRQRSGRRRPPNRALARRAAWPILYCREPQRRE